MPPNQPEDEFATLAVDRENPAAGLRLRILGEGLFATHPLPPKGELVIGRTSQAAIQIDHASISRRHALLRVGPPLTIEDLGSANGTSVAGHPLAAGTQREIHAGEVIDLGAVMAVIQGQLSAAPRGAARAGEALSARGPDAVVVSDVAMERLHVLVERVAVGEISVLLLGETGVGKEVLAETVHRRSRRAGKPFVKLNCASLSETLLESELFGHEKGAFTGAVAAKPGLLEAADGGTVFLDEVGEMSATTQAKLLRVLEEKKVLRVGGTRPRAIDVRFISATNRDLEADIARGSFRQDLFFRLDGISLVIPPLRQRPAEIEPLAKAFLAEGARKAGLPSAPAISTEARDILRGYSWPGNLRELRNVMERAALLCGGEPVQPEHLPVEKMRGEKMRGAGSPPAGPAESSGLKADVQEMEKQRILQALEECAGNQTRAARLLGISRGTLVSRLAEYGVRRPRKQR